MTEYRKYFYETKDRAIVKLGECHVLKLSE